ncbi:MAG: PDZ domain-containing protein, partial [Dokdonella sp.]
LLLLGSNALSVTAQAAKPATASPAESSSAEDAAARAEMADLQKQLAALSSRMAEVSMKMAGNGPRTTALRYLASPNKAMVGLVLSESEQGVLVGGVSPDGPAAQAGMKSGDIIIRVRDRNIGSSDPAKALQQARDALANLDDGDDVEIGYRRDGKLAKAMIKATRQEAVNSYRLLADGSAVDMAATDRSIVPIVNGNVADSARAEPVRDAGLSRVELRRSMSGMPWWGINLAELNPDLGRYFGTDQGVLVLSTDGDALAGVRAGDVIQQVDGGKVRRPEDAVRRLRDQPAESEVAMQLLRERKPVTLKIRVPDNQSMFAVMPPPPPPVPAAPGTPASPPPPLAPPAPVAPGYSVSTAMANAKAASAINPDTPATIAAVIANPDLLSRVLPPRAAAKGGAVGSPGLWGGRIRSIESNDSGTCYIVAATTLDKDGKPVRGDFRGTFSACTVEPLDKTQFVGGRYATFLGTITGPRRDRLSGPWATMTVTDAVSWSPVPQILLPPPPPPTPYRG